MNLTRYETIELSLDPLVGFALAEIVARMEVSGKGELDLIAWWDSDRDAGGPVETCGGEAHPCSASYAEGHGAGYRVVVNGGRFEFYFARREGEWEELEERALRDVHRGLPEDSADNVQGG